MVESDPAKRAEIYDEFNTAATTTTPRSSRCIVALGRRYQQRWVNGWFTNPIFPGTYYYGMSKQ